MRELVQLDDIPATLDTAPANISFQLGQLNITFTSMEQLAASLLALAQILDDPEQFATVADRYVPRQDPSPEDQQARQEVQRLFAELAQMERQRRQK